MKTLLNPILEQQKKERPGEYLSSDDIEILRRQEPALAPCIDAAIAAEKKEQEILDRVIPDVLKKYDFRGRYEYGPEKCYRDVGAVYRYAVFAMLCNDLEMLENKLLIWMGTIVRSLNFPGGNESIRYTYEKLRREAIAALGDAHGRLLEPYLTAAVVNLPTPTQGR